MQSVLQKITITAHNTQEKPEVIAASQLCHAFALAAQNGFDMALAATLQSETELMLSPLLQDLPETALLVTLDAPDGAKGCMAIDPQVLAGLIEMQTLGQVSTQAAAPRLATHTDALMCESFVNKVFETADELLRPLQRGEWFFGYRFGTRIEEVRKLGLALKNVSYRFYQLEIDMGLGAKRGQILIALPSRLEKTLGNDSETKVRHWHEMLSASVMTSVAQIDAILHRYMAPLFSVQALKAGDILTLPASALSSVSLETNTGIELANARLGQLHGCRAVRLISVEDKGAVTPHLASISGSPAPQVREANEDNSETSDGLEENQQEDGSALPLKVMSEKP